MQKYIFNKILDRVQAEGGPALVATEERQTKLDGVWGDSVQK